MPTRTPMSRRYSSPRSPTLMRPARRPETRRARLDRSRWQASRKPSDLLGEMLAEQPAGPQHQDRDQHRKRDGVSPVSPYEPRAEALRQPQEEAPEHGATEVADSAEHGRGEGLEPRHVAHEEVDDAVVEAHHDARAGREDRPDQEGEPHDAVDFDPHEAGGLG